MLIMLETSIFSLYRIAGKDAAAFLQGQLTRDIRKITTTAMSRAAFCNAQGKVIAVFYLYRQEDSFMLLCPSEIAEPTMRRLQMFTLHQDVSITRQPESMQFTHTPSEMPLAITPNCALTFSDTNSGTLDDASAIDALIDAEFPLLNSATQNTFLPQMLGLETHHGLDYDKGCYVGQEVIARAHFKAPVRRHLQRLQLLSAPFAPTPGTPLYADTVPAGILLQATPEKALAVIQDRYQDALLRDKEKQVQLRVINA